MDDLIRIYPIATDTAGCFYQRLKMPLDALERVYPGRYEVCWTCEPQAGGVVLGQRLVGHGDEANPQWRLWRERGDLALLYEIDDLITEIDPGNAIPYGALMPQRLGTLKTIGMSDAVIVSTNGLRKYVKRQWPDMPITVGPNSIESWSEVNFSAVDLAAPEVILWAGSQFHGQDFPIETIAELAFIRDALPALEWVTIGGSYIPWARHIGWSDIPGYHANLRQFAGRAIGIVPVIDTEFNRSKSWIKALDYAANGIIPVVPDFGDYRLAVSHRFAWAAVPSLAQGVVDLMSMERLRRLFWSRSMHHEAQNWTIEETVGRWATAIRRAQQRQAERVGR